MCFFGNYCVIYMINDFIINLIEFEIFVGGFYLSSKGWKWIFEVIEGKVKYLIFGIIWKFINICNVGG